MNNKIKLNLIFLIILLASCSKSAEIEESIILAGDGGKANQSAISTLVEQTKINSRKTSVYFLGDNIYNNGLPEKENKEYQVAYQRLVNQIDPFKSLPSKLFFIPGNHDWDSSGPKGWDYLKNQAKMVRTLISQGDFVPDNGCPGPVVVEDKSWLRVIAWDSQWWLHTYSKPSKEEDGCSVYTQEMFLSALEKLLASTPKEKAVVLLQHHPLKSIGAHSKSSNHCNQNMGCETYKQMISSVSSILNKYPPLLCAAGHDHSLQVLEGGYGCKKYVVTGTISNSTSIAPDNQTLYASSTFGFVRLDLDKQNKIILSVIESSRTKSEGRVAYRLNLN